MATAFHDLAVAEVEPLTDDAVAVTFTVPDHLAERYAFTPGQSLTLRRFVDGVEQRRTYSICSPAGRAPRIGVREIPDGTFSSWLVREVAPGDRVQVAPPDGTFTCPPDLAGRHLCIAAGSGITPMLSIAASLLEGSASRVTLLYGNRETRSVMFAEELADLKDRHGPRFDLVHVLSREPRDVELFSGRLDADRLRELVRLKAPQGLDHAWLCGPLGLVETAREVLAEAGVPAERIHSELFFVDAPPPVLRHPDRVVAGETSEVSVVLDGRRTTAPMPRDTTILDSVQAQRGDVPFACKGGVCGTCRARVVDGEVDMVRNYALEDDEVERGFVLTCQSFPLGEKVTVDFDA